MQQIQHGNYRTYFNEHGNYRTYFDQHGNYRSVISAFFFIGNFFKFFEKMKKKFKIEISCYILF